MTSPDILCLPGFGDPVVGERWVAELAEQLDGHTVAAADWPGLWTRWAEPVSYRQLLDEAIAAAADGTILVGHSLGGRIAIDATAAAGGPGCVAVCSPAQLGLSSGDAAQRWRDNGTRMTQRVAPNGMAVTYQLPVVFLDEVLEHLGDIAAANCRTHLIFGADDDNTTARPESWNTAVVANTSFDVVAGCAHRFMDDTDSRRAVIDIIVDKIDALDRTRHV